MIGTRKEEMKGLGRCHDMACRCHHSPNGIKETGIVSRREIVRGETETATETATKTTTETEIETETTIAAGTVRRQDGSEVDLRTADIDDGARMRRTTMRAGIGTRSEADGIGRMIGLTLALPTGAIEIASNMTSRAVGGERRYTRYPIDFLRSNAILLPHCPLCIPCSRSEMARLEGF